MFQKSTNHLNKYEKRREFVFLLLAGLFIGTLAMLNILGITRIIDLSFEFFGIHVPFRVFVGILPYPLTFLCTDFISEFYGKKRASYVVWIGFVLNLWVIFILWIGGILPPVPVMNPETGLPFKEDANFLFYQLRSYTFSATFASMIAYLTAQFVDVHVFHFLKKLSSGKKLWLRNNGSTLTSQLVDSLSVILITFFMTNAIRIPAGFSTVKFLFILVISNYFFKLVAALLDTIPFYIGVKYLTSYLKIDPVSEYRTADK
ncbi:MAG: queuosine precursor transporter [Bacteroidales bacterium]|nr:queuosine precursor transporter [Bacteroidales bacterium]